MKTHAIPATDARRSSAVLPTRPDAAAVMATKFESVFAKAFFVSKTPAAKAVGSASKRRLFVTHVGHQAPILDRDAAAYWACKSMPATTLNLWFEASGLERKKDLFVALQVSASTLSRAKPHTILDTAVTERMLRQSELFVRAAEVFGEDGVTWMTKPHDLLDGKAPVEYATNEFGGAKVRQILNAIEYGGAV
ncbi:antitoxin Xre/MbcA/ParS toxin-binding domain-containing protein [Variovorax gossypii]